MNVDERGDRLNLSALLCMVDKVSLAGLVFGVPFEDVELCAHSKRKARDRDGRWVILEDYLLGAVGPGRERYRRRHAEKSVVLRRQSLGGSP